MDIKVTLNEGLRYGSLPASETYVAIDRSTYDADCDQDGFFSTSPVGYGATENAAIRDLIEQIDDEDEYREALDAFEQMLFDNSQFGGGA